ncbi:hypothetical protein KI387_041463, partial [Taxus chinensis]
FTRPFVATGRVLGRIPAHLPTTKYQLVAKGPDYEIREYEASIAAQVTSDPTQMERRRDGGFMFLTDYIGLGGEPKNAKPQTEQQEGEQIAMTSQPVSMTFPILTAEASESGDNTKKLMTMQFTLASGYTLENVPRPTDSRVCIKELPERKYGVVTFGGIANQCLVKNMVEKLRKSLEEGGYKVVGNYVSA